MENTELSSKVRAAFDALECLREADDGCSKSVLARHARVSVQTMQRSLHWLMNEHDAPIEYTHGRWRLGDDAFTLPLLNPQREDLSALLLAEAMLGSIADHDLRSRLRRLAEQLDERIRRSDVACRPHTGGVQASMTLGIPLDPDLLSKVLRSIGTSVAMVRYRGVWNERRCTYRLEPWQVRVHDGAAYLRAWNATEGRAWTLRMAEIEDFRVVEGSSPSTPLPRTSEIWDVDPAYGVDRDRPNTAVIRFSGAISRWVKPTIWHPNQQDHTDEEGLTRTVPYRSCRELARRLLSLIDGIDAVEPKELREQMAEYLNKNHVINM